MTTYVSADLRRQVVARALHICEYCLIHEMDTYLGCQVEHIISEKHDGPTDESNLALACTFCNRAKGTDIGSLAPSTGELTRFFNPRTDWWGQNFELRGTLILPSDARGPALRDKVRTVVFFHPKEALHER
jgi:hypothetical protein